MTQSEPNPKTNENGDLPATPLRCFTGSLISGTLGFASYLLASSIAQNFASRPVTSGNILTLNISIAVRTLVVGMTTLVTCIFGFVALGLIALGIQLTIQRLLSNSNKQA